MNTSHLDALHVRLSNEKCHLSAAKTQAEIDIRTVWIGQIEKEVIGEKAFLGIVDAPVVDMDEDELLRELGL